jgi:hypothetical protein
MCTQVVVESLKQQAVERASELQRMQVSSHCNAARHFPPFFNGCRMLLLEARRRSKRNWLHRFKSSPSLNLTSTHRALKQTTQNLPCQLLKSN